MHVLPVLPVMVCLFGENCKDACELQVIVNLVLFLHRTYTKKSQRLMIGIINYGDGNIVSVINALEYCTDDRVRVVDHLREMEN